MSVLSGYNKYKRYILTSSGYKLCSHWTSSNTVHFDDGKTAQTKVGAINGITDSLTATSSNVALSSKAGKSLQDQVTQLNTHIQVLGEHVYLAASNKKDWVWVNVPDLNAFRYILLCRTTLNGSSRGCNITTLQLFKSLNNSSLTFSVDDTDTTLACYSSDTKVGLYSSRDDRQTMLFGIR